MPYEELPLQQDPRYHELYEKISDVIGDYPEDGEQMPEIGLYAIVVKRHFHPDGHTCIQEFSLIDTTMNSEEKNNCVRTAISEDKELGELKVANVFNIN